ncbi:MAG: helix-turn-helix transcriptional regulator [Gemmatimonadota bacterium]|nr:helix-turn-helix transcriptional regulator [Gemmatimonadota bacterium]
MTFGQSLRKARREAAHTQRSLAAGVGVDFSYISKVENDRIPPPAGDTIERICRFLSVPAEPLLALSRKVPAEVSGALAASPGAVGFLRKAAGASLTEAEWEQLTRTLDRLRPPGGGQDPAEGLPESMRDLFWDHPFEDLSWPADRDFVIARILGAGDWDSVTWLRERVEPDQLRQWLVRRRCRGLDARRIRFWELILGLPADQVEEWVREAWEGVWENRLVRDPERAADL